jgi:hypothetical protein
VRTWLLAAMLALGVVATAAAQETPEPGPTESVPAGPRVEVEVAGWLYSLEPDVLFQACVIEQRSDFTGVWDMVRLFVLQPDGEFEATGPLPAQAVGPLEDAPQGACVALDRLTR